MKVALGREDMSSELELSDIFFTDLFEQLIEHRILD